MVDCWCSIVRGLPGLFEYLGSVGLRRSILITLPPRHFLVRVSHAHEFFFALDKLVLTLLRYATPVLDRNRPYILSKSFLR